MRNKIINYIRAGYPGLYIVSAEEQRVEAQSKPWPRKSTSISVSEVWWTAW
jgi:hypothetical protein